MRATFVTARMKKVVVTGGAGFIGSHTVVELVAAGYEVFAFDPVPAINAYPGPKLIIDTNHADGRHALYRQVPEVPRQVIAGPSHWPQLDKPGEFNRVLDKVL